MEKNRLKSNFLPYHVKKNHSILEVDTFKVMLLDFKRKGENSNTVNIPLAVF